MGHQAIFLRMVTLPQLKEDFAPRVKEELLAQGKDPDVKPTHRWLRENKFWGVFTYCRGREETVDEILLNELGFDERPTKPLPGHSTETKQLLHDYIAEETDIYNRVNGTSTDDLSTHMRLLMDLSLETFGHADLVKIARMSRREQFFALRDLFSSLQAHLEKQGSAYNYATTLVEFYDWLVDRGDIDGHRAAEMRTRFDWEYDRTGPSYVLTTDEVHQLWQATETLTEKVIIILLFAAGLRPADIQVLTEDGIYLDPADPHLEFGPERKNGAGEPVLLAGDHILKRHLEILNQDPDWNGEILPSDRSKSGVRSYNYIQSQFDDVVERSGLTIDRDDYDLTPTAGRDFYMNILGEARHQFMHGVAEPTAKAAGSSSERVVNKHYLQTRKNRRFIRKYASPFIEAAFGDQAISPAEEDDAQHQSHPGQTKMQEWIDDEAAVSLLGPSTIGQSVHRATAAVDRRITPRLGDAASSLHACNRGLAGRAAIGVAGVTVLAVAIAASIQTATLPLPESAGLLASSLLIGIASVPADPS